MKHICIIGNSAAAISAVEAIRGHDSELKITLLSDEEYPAYCRCLISYLIAGDISESKLSLRPEDFYEKNKIELILGQKVIKVNSKKRYLTLANNEKIEFDNLLIATGARPSLPEIKGINKNGVSGFRTLGDAKEILFIAAFAKSASVLGGGLIGLKAASALRRKGIEVKVIVKSGNILSQVLDKTGADIVAQHLESQGIEILTGREAVEIIGNGQARAVKLDSGKVIESAIIIVGKGVSPNIGLVKETDIKTDYGILTNEYLETNLEGIYAAGDVAETFDLVRGSHYINALWPNAIEQGRVAGLNLAGQRCAYLGSLSLNSVDFFGLPVISIGLKKETEASEAISFVDKRGAVYKKIIIKDGRLLGFIGVGNIKNSGIFLRLIRERTDISSIKDKLLDESFNYGLIYDRFKEKDNIYVGG